MISLDFNFTGKLWAFYSEKASWTVVTVPIEISQDIKAFTKNDRPGFKTVRVSVKLGESEWLTSLFPDKKSGCYFLPLKAAIRKSENVSVADEVNITLEVFI